MERWVPLTQYAIEEGISISTLRRKIKSNAISFRLDGGRYLIKSEGQGRPVVAAPAERPKPVFATVSSDAPRPVAPRPAMSVDSARPEMAEMELKWRALEARLNGLSKKVDFLIEQNSELNMLVKVFEEKLDGAL